MSSFEEITSASITKLESDTEPHTLRPHRPPPPPPPPPPASTQSEPTTPVEFENISSSTEILDESNNNIEDNRPSLLFQFNELFDSFDYGIIRSKILNREMITSEFTTVLWRIFLHCLPRDSSQWNQVLDISRDTYAELADKYPLDIQKIIQHNKDLNNPDHPLSQEESSVWYQNYIYDGLKDNIYQDVIRTCQEISYFQQKHILDLLLKILYIHSRHYEQTLPYRQGMHEILAVIVYLIDSESRIINEYSESNELMKKLYDPEYLAHDAYGIYEKIMEHLQQFYDFKPYNIGSRKNANTLFQRGYDLQVQTNDTVTRVNSIIEQLKYFDHPLYAKLQELNIEPMVYGIRWLRLLFGREIPFGSIPNLWTIIFCYDECFGFVDYFFLALLFEIGQIFKENDISEYSLCLQYLMKPNVISDVEKIIKKALELEKFSRNKDLQSTISRNVSTNEIQKPPIQNSSQNSSMKNEFNSPIQLAKVPPSKIPKGAEMEDSPGKETREKFDSNNQMQKYCAELMHKFINRIRNGVNNLQSSNTEEIIIQLNGLEQIASVLDGTLVFDDKSLQTLINYRCKENSIENHHNYNNTT